MDGENRKTFYIEHDLQNGFRSHNSLCKLAIELKETTSKRITLDISNANFIASNLFSVLGCILSDFGRRSELQDPIWITGVKPSINDTICKNGFCTHFGINKTRDLHNTVIPYKIFPIDGIAEYERYLTLNLFARKDLPVMSPDAADNFRDSMLELFKNVMDHTTSSYIFTCGQYFPKSHMLYYSIVDYGETIAYNVQKYHEKHHLLPPKNALQWAVESGNTTKTGLDPRGIGLALIRLFVFENQGNFYLVSANETYEINKHRERFKQLDYSFPGTIVTIGFNIKHTTDTSDTDNIIQF